MRPPRLGGVKAKTRLLLFHVFAGMAAGLSRGALTRSLLTGSYGSGLDRELNALEAAAFLETLPAGPADRVWRLTAKGRDAVFGGRDPERLWNRAWDGRWRCVFFDLPRKRNADRSLLRRALRARGFGCMQGSVWITPDPLNEVSHLKGDVFAKSLVFFEGRPCGGESDEDLVAAAWHWTAIDSRYQSLEGFLESRPTTGGCEVEGAWTSWTRREFALWLDLARLDPFLPRHLCPDGYRGFDVWRLRQKVYSRAMAVPLT